MSSLVERAKKAPARSSKAASDEEIELALAWLCGEITSGQIADVLYPEIKRSAAGGKVLYRVATWLRAAYTQGWLQKTAPN